MSLELFLHSRIETSRVERGVDSGVGPGSGGLCYPLGGLRWIISESAVYVTVL
jgi:hypothetical protein